MNFEEQQQQHNTCIGHILTVVETCSDGYCVSQAAELRPPEVGGAEISVCSAAYCV